MGYREPGATNVGALIIRIGFGGISYTIIIIRNLQNSVSNYLGSYISYIATADRQKSRSTGPRIARQRDNPVEEPLQNP